MKANLAVRALNNAVARRGEVAGCIVDSDRCSQFRSRKFTRALALHGVKPVICRTVLASDGDLRFAAQIPQSPAGLLHDRVTGGIRRPGGPVWA